ncbi:DUF481 domain-containing protein [Ferrimonas lipolytica]|uniref:DUF481 domain-containing protein n=1 Tax=Ferrimonas lipolytica TaxID=2724191 RepID=A0A6H1UJ54_9GAMM|nr:DUF481 domain-containing protein [Ferrimonas lipolytica]QIZ78659.1 DUF481 domain-containing protein [Ferrimonas lipolytica]
MRALFYSALFLSAPAMALVPPNYSDPEKNLSSEIELGMQYTSGNSDTSNFNSRVKAIYDGDAARHEWGVWGYFASDEDETSAEQYQFQYQLDYKLAGSEYIYGRGDLKWDRFGSYTRKHTFSSGYGWTPYETKDSELILEVGLGYRYNKVSVSEESDDDLNKKDEAIFRTAAKWEHKLQEYTTFTADATIETGDVNTVADLKLAYRNQFWADLALKFGVDITYTDKVPEDSEKTDVISTVNLIYSF